MKKRLLSPQFILPILWVLFSLLPYPLVGEWWGATWFPLNYPLSALLKPHLWDYGKPVYLATVTLLNAFVILGLTGLIKVVLRRLNGV